ncbi:hypothetical protein ACFSUS_15050 [Spirosoma soli]|uniref:TonB C-terminal domain-containing protein n=1 Tax=Spirosoma soli TaxID=1770529 RepID=A0ABW5M5J2_9BACT
MKQLLIMLLSTSYLVAGSYSKAEASIRPGKDLQKQLAVYITFPELLQKTAHNSSVTIQFRIATDNRVEHLQVFSQDQQLNQDLIHQLMGKKLKVSKSEQGMLHTVRLRFVQE